MVAKLKEKPVTIASVVLEELNYLMKKNKGILKPEQVVEYARNPKSALHGQFEWDDTKAAQEYRLWQARHLFRVFVTYIHDDLPACNVFVSMKSERGEGYRPMVDVLNDEQLTAQLLDDAYQDWQIYKRKYNGLVKLVKAFEEMDKAFEK